jgi:hypothetical protein
MLFDNNYVVFRDSEVTVREMADLQPE